MTESQGNSREHPRQWWRNTRALILALVPGLGHASMGYLLFGSILFSIFLFSLNGAFLGRVLLSDPKLSHLLQKVSLPICAATWLISLIHSWRIGFGRDRPRSRVRRRELLQRGLQAYLQGRLDDAHRALTRAVRYDYDWEDAVLLFHLGVINLRLASQASESGQSRVAAKKRRAARRAFERYIDRDLEQTWRGEIFAECQRAGIPIPRRLKVDPPI